MRTIKTPDHVSPRRNPELASFARPVGELLERWRQELGPVAEELLARAGELELSDLIELLLTDMAERWQRGERKTAANYVRDHPRVLR